MKYIKQLGILFSVSCLGEVLHRVLPLPIPASVYGLVLMLTALCTGLLPVESVRETARLLVQIMPLLFVPSAVGLLTVWEVLRPVWPMVLGIVLLSTILVLGAAGKVTDVLLGREECDGDE